MEILVPERRELVALDEGAELPAGEFGSKLILGLSPDHRAEVAYALHHAIEHVQGGPVVIAMLVVVEAVDHVEAVDDPPALQFGQRIIHAIPVLASPVDPLPGLLSCPGEAETGGDQDIGIVVDDFEGNAQVAQDRHQEILAVVPTRPEIGKRDLHRRSAPMPGRFGHQQPPRRDDLADGVLQRDRDVPCG